MHPTAIASVLLLTACAAQHVPARDARSNDETSGVTRQQQEGEPSRENEGEPPEPAPQPERGSWSAKTLTIAGFTVQAVGIGGLIGGAALGAQQNSSARSAGSELAIGGAAALLLGTLLASVALPEAYATSGAPHEASPGTRRSSVAAGASESAPSSAAPADETPGGSAK